MSCRDNTLAYYLKVKIEITRIFFELASSLGYFIARKKSVSKSVVGSKFVSPFNLIMHFGEQYAITSADISSTAILSTKCGVTKCGWAGWGVGVSCELNDRLFSIR